MSRKAFIQSSAEFCINGIEPGATDAILYITGSVAFVSPLSQPDSALWRVQWVQPACIDVLGGRVGQVDPILAANRSGVPRMH